jgi:hypothetical protein
MSMIQKNEADLESCFGEFADIVEGLPQSFLPKKVEDSLPPSPHKSETGAHKSINRQSSLKQSYWVSEN